MTTDSPLRDRLRAALLDARRSRDAEAAATLRTALAALENAEAVPVAATSGAIKHAPVGAGSTEAPRRVLSDADEREVIDAEIASLVEAAEAYAASVPERAEAAHRAAGILSQLRDT